VAHVAVYILDDKGRVVPTANNEVSFEIEGAGLILGTDNGDPASHEDYKSNRRKAFNGLCLAIVKSNGKAGRIQVKAVSPALQSASVIIATKV
jgi:beta-galactosidase